MFLSNVIWSQLGLPSSLVRTLGLVSLSIFFVTIGIDHFLNREFYVSIMPPYMPVHLELVYISGILEIIGGLCILYKRLRRWSGCGLMLLLVAVYPANIHMAMNPHLYTQFSAEFLYFRLILQFVFLYWVYWVSFSETHHRVS